MIRDALLDALAILLPVDCAGCGAPDRAVCAQCLALLAPDPTTRLTPGGLRVVAAVEYAGVVRRVILALKQQDRTDAAAPLSGALAAAVRAAAGPETLVVVPVPTSRAAFRDRGYDPVALLLRRAGVPFERALAHTRRTAHQKSLGVAERAANLRGAFSARPVVTGRRVLLIDDVMTSGATLDEASRALREAGAEVVAGATLAFTKRIRPTRDIARGEDYGKAKGAQNDRR